MAYEIKNYESFYDGGHDPWNSSYGSPINYQMSSGALGTTTNPMVANQLSEVITKIKEGVKNVELGTIKAEDFESIPKQQFHEIRALMKLSGVKPSMHAPIIDPAGFGERGWNGEASRIEAENRIFNVVKEAHKLDGDGRIPVTIHSSASSQGPIYGPEKIEGERKLIQKKNFAVDQKSGQLIPLERDRTYYAIHPEDFEKGGTMTDVDKQLRMSNDTTWADSITKMADNKKNADQVLNSILPSPTIIEMQKLDFRKKEDAEKFRELVKNDPSSYDELQKASLFLNDASKNFTSLFDRAYRFGSDEQREKLKEMANDWQKAEAEYKEKVDNRELPKNDIAHQIRMSRIVDKKLLELQDITSHEEGPFSAPQIYKKIEDFATEKSSQTFGNVAFKAWKQFGESAPIVSIENLDPERGTFSRAKEMEKLIEESRKVFAKQLVKEGGFSEKKAKEIAEKQIGATWDVGHLNMHKKFGLTDDDLIKETERISKMVKHVHLTDNFGYADTHLAPGMGNVDFKRQLEMLEKKGVLKNARSIVEAGGLINHFKTSPVPYTLSVMNSPIYGAKMGPTWAEANYMRATSYFGFPLAHLPEKHFSTYGSGFSMLPEELGGQIPGSGSRFSGAGMA